MSTITNEKMRISTRLNTDWIGASHRAWRDLISTFCMLPSSNRSRTTKAALSYRAYWIRHTGWEAGEGREKRIDRIFSHMHEQTNEPASKRKSRTSV